MALTGCTVGPNYKRPKVEIPGDYRAATVAKDQPPLVDTKWWDLFKDPQLQALIRLALDQNKDLRLAVARVDAARAQLGIVGAGRYPQVGAGASATATLGSETGARPVPAGEDRTAHLYRVGFTFAWEMDLWGKYRRATEAARAQLLATEEVRQAVAISLVSSVAQTYLQLRELDLELQITEKHDRHTAGDGANRGRAVPQRSDQRTRPCGRPKAPWPPLRPRFPISSARLPRLRTRSVSWSGSIPAPSRAALS